MHNTSLHVLEMDVRNLLDDYPRTKLEGSTGDQLTTPVGLLTFINSSLLGQHLALFEPRHSRNGACPTYGATP
jgi:hypothetical protein